MYFVCIDMEANACSGSFQTMQQCLVLVRCICQNRYVIGVVGVGNCFGGVPSASFLCQLEAVFSDFITSYESKRTLFKQYIQKW